jgi:hypothetical protein
MDAVLLEYTKINVCMGGFGCAVGKMGDDCADLIPFDCGEGYRRCV